MLPPMRFRTDVCFTWHNGYCSCYRPVPYSQVVISRRLQEIITHNTWSQALPEELEEIRALYELGFLTIDTSDQP
ncbi:MAG: hypothetical protein H0U76_04175 [Ktedonobacteraceae bacterium]|nr:hypothetical protein [Ktedonobacteraceae bacterium]